MADNTDISQSIGEVAANSSEARVSQTIPEVGASAPNAQISQSVQESGADSSAAQVSQLPIEVGANKASVSISQLTIELGRGPEISPPLDTPADTYTFDEGLGNSWFLVLQLSDSGQEWRDKVVKSLRATGKFTRGLMKGYGYGPLADIDVSQIEQGIGQRVTVTLTDTTQVQQTKRFQVNLPNSMMHTIRVEGIWDGLGDRDRIDEIVCEVAGQGIRR